MHQKQTAPYIMSIYKEKTKLTCNCSKSLLFVLLAACADGYVTYNYTNTQICLKYVSSPAMYPDAVQHCQLEGGDLIRLDSKLKYDILTELLGWC